MINAIESAPLPDGFKAQISTSIEHVKYNEKTIIIITIPPQKGPIFFNKNKVYIRKDSSTHEIKDLEEIIALSDLFK